jgi:hypothetical protein
MPVQMQTGSYTTRLPFHVNDVGNDDLFSITVASGSANIPAGTAMAEVTATGEYEPYDEGSGGDGTAVGFLINDVDPSFGPELGSLMVRGDVRSGSVFGMDAGAFTDLAGRFFFV